MCLGVPGKILSIEANPLGMTMGKVSFGGVAKEVCLAYTPEAEVGDYVIVHAGFALNKLDEQEAQEVFALLAEMQEAELRAELWVDDATEAETARQ
jgi:hydrogenase expression/formation protein HypC